MDSKGLSFTMNDDKKLLSYAYHVWKRRKAKEELVCWGTKTTINVGDIYYEYEIDLTLYGTKIEMNCPVVTEREYFKQTLKGFPGFKYYDKN